MGDININDTKGGRHYPEGQEGMWTEEWVPQLTWNDYRCLLEEQAEELFQVGMSEFDATKLPRKGGREEEAAGEESSSSDGW